MKKLDVEKLNLINLAKHHRKHCEGESCNISLMLVMQVAERTGIKFTKKEMKEFI